MQEAKTNNNPIFYPYLIIGWGDEVLGPGGIWGRVQGVSSDHWGTTGFFWTFFWQLISTGVGSF